jgi:tubulin delta
MPSTKHFIQLLTQCTEVFYYKKLSFTKQEGSGNNWAYGYNVHGPKTEEEILKRVNRLLEETDYMQVF